MARRSRVNKAASARRFRAHSQRTRGINMSAGPMRGGIRL